MFTLSVGADEYREHTHAAVTKPAELHLGTAMVEPVGNKQWVREGSDQHARSAARGRANDAESVTALLGWARRTPDVEYYTPRVADIARLDRWPAPEACLVPRGKKRDHRRFGELPAILARVHENQLGEKSIGAIQTEMRERSRTEGSRLFSR